MTRVTRRRSIAAGVLTSCLVLTAACGDDDNEPETLPSDGPTSAASSPTPPENSEPTTAPMTPEDEASAEAEQTIRDYVGFTDELVTDKTIDLEGLGAFLQDPELTDRRDFYQRFRDQGFYSNGGATAFEWVKPTKVKLYPKAGEAEVAMKVCLNLDAVTVRDKSGKRIDLLSPALATYEVYNYDYPSSTGWKIAVEQEPGKRCRP